MGIYPVIGKMLVPVDSSGRVVDGTKGMEGSICDDLGESSKAFLFSRETAESRCLKAAFIIALFKAGKECLLTDSFMQLPAVSVALPRTPEDWGTTDRERSVGSGKSSSSSKQLSSSNSGEGLENLFKKKLQRNSKESSLRGSGVGCPSPVPLPGDHSLGRGTPIAIPSAPQSAPRNIIPRMRNSVEGLNQEIERLVLKGMNSHHDHLVREPSDGRCAPVKELLRIGTRSVDTQTPSDGNGMSPLIPLHDQNDVEQKSWTPEVELYLGTSPSIKGFSAREPPDGCEKPKVPLKIEDARLKFEEDTMDFFPKHPLVTFELKPSSGSAFYPLCKSYLGRANEANLNNTG
ncbi:unnamed protein product [Darwinula stevensoni]|uniref:Uncharacterized protein n=1 Tax=Darwinula stevensoni TaxID=69355 RepID=A0A7R8X141_9CRUS|nr:unnamed protein product [Darwinula stevensoni]CAG0879569.1 unnamed protein product [Darwinula stevensoni]